MATKTIIITAVPASKAGTIGPFAIKKTPTIVSKPGGIMSKLPYSPITTTVSTSPTIISSGVKRPVSNNGWENMAPSRKRERLTHLSQEEKLNRRKLKNRIAAQTARDRKKVKMNVLEDSVEEMQTENETLLIENSELRQQTIQLLEENALLKKQLEEANREKELLKQQRKSDTESVVGSQVVALGSAAGAGDHSGQHSLRLDPPDYALEAILRDLLEGSEQFGPEGAGSQLQHQEHQFGQLEEALKSESVGDSFIPYENFAETSPALAVEGEVLLESALMPTVQLVLEEGGQADSDIFLSDSVTSLPPPQIITSMEFLKPSSPFGIVPTSPRHDLISSDPARIAAYNNTSFVNFPEPKKSSEDQKPQMDVLDFGFEDSDLSNFLMDTNASPMWADSFTDLFQTVS